MSLPGQKTIVSWPGRAHVDSKLYHKPYYHINYCVIQGFPALRKAVTTHVEKIWYISTFVWYRQSAADKSLAFRATRSSWWLNGKAFTILSTRKFVASVMAFLAAENENRPLEDLPRADSGRLPKRLLLSVRTKSINENFEIENYAHCCFCYHVSILSLGAKARYDCVFFYFHSLIKLAFLSLKGYCVYMINKIIHDISLVRSAHSWALRVEHSERNFITTRAHVFPSIYTAGNVGNMKRIQ